MKLDEYEWCEVCDGDGETNGIKCARCGGRGHYAVDEEQRKRDVAAAAQLQALLDERKKNGRQTN